MSLYQWELHSAEFEISPRSSSRQDTACSLFCQLFYYFFSLPPRRPTQRRRSSPVAHHSTEGCVRVVASVDRKPSSPIIPVTPTTAQQIRQVFSFSPASSPSSSTAMAQVQPSPPNQGAPPPNGQGPNMSNAPTSWEGDRM